MTDDSPFRSGFACFVGRPNAGKSTLTNALVGRKIVITSSRPQTTRHAVRGIVHRPDAQLVLVDTPGLHRPRTLLGQRLNDVVRATWSEVDVIGACLPADQRVQPDAVAQSGDARGDLGGLGTFGADRHQVEDRADLHATGVQPGHGQGMAEVEVVRGDVRLPADLQAGREDAAGVPEVGHQVLGEHAEAVDVGEHAGLSSNGDVPLQRRKGTSGDASVVDRRDAIAGAGGR